MNVQARITLGVTLLLAVLQPAGSVLAEGTQPPQVPPTDDSQVIPWLGPDVPGLVSGEGGYRVFGPNAVLIVPIEPVASGPDSIETIYRAGWTDAYLGSYPKHNGSHNSQSDLVEQENWVDGAIRPQSQPGSWRDSCSKHQGGQFSNCPTSYDATGTSVAHSWHYFHTSGYADSDFQTEDTV